MNKALTLFWIKLILLLVLLLSPDASQAQPNQPVASEPEAVGAMSSTKASSDKAADTAGYSQNEDSRSLEEKIFVYNREYCPPEAPITEISDFNLLKLARAQLINRADLGKYEDMVLVDGKVYVKKDGSEENPDEKKDEKPGDKLVKAGKNLTGSFETACKELKNKRNRGKNQGNKKTEKVLDMKRRKVTYRDRDNQLREMEVYSPPKFPAKKKDISGKKGKKVSDYATSILVPKDVDPKDAAAFEDMPSADAWIED